MDQSAVKRTAFRMTEARAMLVRELPFFGNLAMRLQLACGPCGTACTDGERLIFDPAFAERLSDRELQFVILHEVFHCVLEHYNRGRNLQSYLYNVACDLVVNSMILELWGLNTFQVCGEEPMHLLPDGQEGRLFSSEEIYQMLLSKGDEDVWPSVSPGSVDRHDVWTAIQDPVRMKDEWNNRIRQAEKACGDTTGLPQSVRNIITDLSHRSNVDWRQVLHDFIQFDNSDYSFLPPDRRFCYDDLFLPAFHVDESQGRVGDLWICVDTSGSVSVDELSEAMMEIMDAMRQVGLTGILSFFDTEISDPVLIESEDIVRNLQPTGGGGTSFANIFLYMREKMYPKLPKAILIFTDGYAFVPPEKDSMDVPVLWIIHKNGKKNFPWGRVVEM